jgi:two-component system, NarL family, sensor histidine kinase UhpB
VAIPSQPGELEGTELASALTTILRVALVSMPLLLLLLFVQPEYSWRWITIVAAMYALAGVTFSLHRLGFTRGAALIHVVGLWCVITISALTAGGTGSLALWFFGVFVLITGLFFGPRAGFAATAVAIVTALILLLLELRGSLPWAALPYTAGARWISLVIVLAFMSGLQWFATHTIATALERSRQQAAEHRRTEESLRRAMERAETLVHSIDGIVWEADASTFVFTFVSPQAERLLGYPCSRWLSEPGFWKDHIHPDDRDHALAYCLACTAQMRAHDFEYRMIAVDGREIWLRDLVSVEAENGRPKTLRGIMVDVTKRKRAEQAVRASENQLRALSARLESAREEEGRRIGREIHDELGGTLAALKWDLDSVVKNLTEPVEPRKWVQVRTMIPAMLDLIEDTMTAVRRIAADLRPPVLDDLGVVAAIEWQVRQFESRTGIDCGFDSATGAPELDRERGTAVFRILQEILTNVLRHAHATYVTVKIRGEVQMFVLEVRDNGRGIAAGALASPGSLGLLGMRERALLAGGEVRIQGAAGGGTTVLVTIPVQERAVAS